MAARGDLAEEGRLPNYSQVVDNTTKGAFRAPGWETRRGTLSHGGSFVAADAARAPARFGVKIPATNDYSVYAWWPESANGGKARFGVQTAFGLKWSEVDQRADSGMWIKIGTYFMNRGQRFIQVAARSTGGAWSWPPPWAWSAAKPPPEERAVTASGERSRTTDSKALSIFTGRAIVRQARRHIGDRYRYGTCTRTVKSCTCLTEMAVLPFGHHMGMSEGGQGGTTAARGT